MPANIAGMKPKVVRAMNAFLAECKKQGITLLVTQGLRTIAEQDAIYAQGRTKPGKIVTNAKGGTSFHNFGVAFDVCFLVNGKASWTGDWKKLGVIASKFGLEHGDRGWVDLPHFQMRLGHTLADFQAKRVKDAEYA